MASDGGPGMQLSGTPQQGCCHHHSCPHPSGKYQSKSLHTLGAHNILYKDQLHSLIERFHKGDLGQKNASQQENSAGYSLSPDTKYAARIAAAEFSAPCHVCISDRPFSRFAEKRTVAPYTQALCLLEECKTSASSTRRFELGLLALALADC